MVGGLLQGQQRGNLMDFAGGMDQNANPMQTFIKALSSGMPPQMAMGMATMQQRMQPNIGAQPWASTQMTPAQRQNWLSNYGRGVTIQTGPRLLPEKDRVALAEADRDKALGRTGPGFGPGDKKALGEEMDSRLDNARRGFFGRTGRTDYTEDSLFSEWKKLIAANTFDNDNQRENAWALWQQKVNKRGEDWFIDNEVDWDPTDPKWQEAIGLKTTRKPHEMSNIEPAKEYPLTSTTKKEDITLEEIAPILEKAKVPRQTIYTEASKLKSIWGELTHEEKLSAYEALSQGKTAQEVIDYFSRQE